MYFRHNKRSKFVVSERLHPQTLAVVQTRLDALGLEVMVVPDARQVDFAQRDISAVLLQCPDTRGLVYDYSGLAAAAQEHGVSIIQITFNVKAITSIKTIVTFYCRL